MEQARRIRLDILVNERGLAPTRAQARDLILRGRILVDGRAARKPGQTVSEKTALKVVEGTQQFVSRAGLKLAAALDHFGFQSDGLTSLDVGAATGGFTQVLLQAGASRVYAIDVGRGQLHADLQKDTRVISLEGRDVRTLGAQQVPEPVSAIVVDTSFISLKLVLPAALAFAADDAWLIALIKPQFEAGRAAISKGGIVRDQADHDRVISEISGFIASQHDWTVLGVMASPITGSTGNQEYLVGARRGDWQRG